ncbi:type IV toxin-antitoxin system AbiEi family antitoxin domain-containing protein, partial [Corynebacterium sp. H127]
MKSIEVLGLLEAVASEQWGIITAAQAQREGVTRLQLSRLTESGMLERVRRGIYLLPSAQYGPLMDIQIAWVSLDPGVLPSERWDSPHIVSVSHESASLIHQIGNLIPNKYSFSSKKRKQSAQKDIHIHINRELMPGEIDNVDGLPVTSVERTICDLAEKAIEFDYLAMIVVDGLRKEGVRLSVLADKLDKSASTYGVSSGQKLIQACQEEAEAEEDSEERFDRYVSDLIRRTNSSSDFASEQMRELTRGLSTAAMSEQM